jgi:hypothetical protein
LFALWPPSHGDSALNEITATARGGAKLENDYIVTKKEKALNLFRVQHLRVAV